MKRIARAQKIPVVPANTQASARNGILPAHRRGGEAHHRFGRKRLVRTSAYAEVEAMLQRRTRAASEVGTTLPK